MSKDVESRIRVIRLVRLMVQSFQIFNDSGARATLTRASQDFSRAWTDAPPLRCAHAQAVRLVAPGVAAVPVSVRGAPPAWVQV